MRMKGQSRPQTEKAAKAVVGTVNHLVPGSSPGGGVNFGVIVAHLAVTEDGLGANPRG